MASTHAIFLSFLHFLLLLSYFNYGECSGLTSCQKTWCVAKASAEDRDLDDIIRFACSETNCDPIQADGPCFDPNTRISHASVAMNLYYQSRGRNLWNCYFNGSGLIVLTDPS
uniref:X8 domain-containing protein n=1 Tax=Ananas comosus var. bracteatus TaxID=296719 RepID=A0A6V7PML0_ANACO|nr:unnamed protein product [Ananas comosus var. bracteatus]